MNFKYPQAVLGHLSEPFYQTFKNFYFGVFLMWWISERAGKHYFRKLLIWFTTVNKDFRKHTILILQQIYSKPLSSVRKQSLFSTAWFFLRFFKECIIDFLSRVAKKENTFGTVKKACFYLCLFLENTQEWNC